MQFLLDLLAAFQHDGGHLKLGSEAAADLIIDQVKRYKNLTDEQMRKENRYSWMPRFVQKVSFTFWWECRKFVADELSWEDFHGFVEKHTERLEPKYGCTIATKKVSVTYHSTYRLCDKAFVSFFSVSWTSKSY